MLGVSGRCSISAATLLDGVHALLRGEEAYQIINGCRANGVHQKDDNMEHQYCPNEGNHGCEASIQSLVGFE